MLISRNAFMHDLRREKDYLQSQKKRKINMRKMSRSRIQKLMSEMPREHVSKSASESENSYWKKYPQ